MKKLNIYIIIGIVILIIIFSFMFIISTKNITLFKDVFNQDIMQNVKVIKDNIIFMDKEEMTSNTFHNCKDGKCSLIIYSSIKFIEDKGIWKSIEEVKSLKGSGISCEIISDGVHIAECLDYNYTNLKIGLSYNKENLKDYGDEVKDNSMKTNLTIYNYNSIENINIEVLEGNIQEINIEDPLGKVIHFGRDSTIISLNSGNVTDDAHVDSTSADSAHNSANIYYGNYWGTVYRGYIKFDISSIPINQIIDNAKVCFTTDYETAGADYNQYVYHSYNQTWTEATLTYNNQPCGNTLGVLNTTYCNDTSESSFVVPANASTYDYMQCPDITNMISKDYTEGNSRTTIVIMDTEDPASNQYARFYAKAYGKTWLNVTYSLDPTAPAPIQRYNWAVWNGTGSNVSSETQAIRLCSNDSLGGCVWIKSPDNSWWKCYVNNSGSWSCIK